MTIWEARDFCREKINDPTLTDQQRNAYRNALNSIIYQIKLMEDENDGGNE